MALSLKICFSSFDDMLSIFWIKHLNTSPNCSVSDPFLLMLNKTKYAYRSYWSLIPYNTYCIRWNCETNDLEDPVCAVGRCKVWDIRVFIRLLNWKANVNKHKSATMRVVQSLATARSNETNLQIRLDKIGSRYLCAGFPLRNSMTIISLY